jgi:hypothetical protein
VPERGIAGRNPVYPTAQPAFAHLYIVNPLGGTTLSGLFSTYPPLEERMRRLQAMAGGMSVFLLLEVLPRLGQARKRLERLNEPALSLAHVEADEGQVPAAWAFFQQRTATTASKSR